MTGQWKITKRQEILPQKIYSAVTFLEMFTELVQRRATSIELPDFFIPQIDVHESSTSVTLEIELPGLSPQDYTYSITGDLLHIKGEKHKVESLAESRYARSERRFGLFERVIRLPAEVNKEQAEAVFENGILKINLPKLVDESKKG